MQTEIYSILMYGHQNLILIIVRVIMFIRQRTGTVVVLHDFSSDLKKKVFTPATHVFM